MMLQLVCLTRRTDWSDFLLAASSSPIWIRNFGNDTEMTKKGPGRTAQLAARLCCQFSQIVSFCLFLHMSPQKVPPQRPYLGPQIMADIFWLGIPNQHDATSTSKHLFRTAILCNDQFRVRSRDYYFCFTDKKCSFSVSSRLSRVPCVYLYQLRVKKCLNYGCSFPASGQRSRCHSWPNQGNISATHMT